MEIVEDAVAFKVALIGNIGAIMTFLRRDFLKAAVAFSLTPSAAFARPTDTVVRSVPNPSNDHLSVEYAEQLCAQNDPNRPEETQILELQRFRTASLAALQCLAQRDWFILEFGFSEVSADVAHAISRIPGGYVVLHHVERISATALAILAATCSVNFAHVVDVLPMGLRDFASGMDRESGGRLGGVGFEGDFRVDRTLAEALAGLPLVLSVNPLAGERAFEVDAVLALSQHAGPWLGINPCLNPAPAALLTAVGQKPIRRGFYSGNFVGLLANNPRKHVTSHGSLAGPGPCWIYIRDKDHAV